MYSFARGNLFVKVKEGKNKAANCPQDSKEQAFNAHMLVESICILFMIVFQLLACS